MSNIHIPVIYNNKKIFYAMQDSVIIDSASEEVREILPLIGRKVLYKGEEWYITKMGDKIILEKEIPTYHLIIRSYLSKLISSMRAIKPIMIFKPLDDVFINVTLVDDLVDTKVISTSVVSTEDIVSYGKPNKALDLVVDFYNKCKEKKITFEY